MRMVPVSSSNLESVGYDPDTRILRIQFHSGGLYEYYNVPRYIHAGLMSAASHGEYFHEYIRDVYSYRKLD